MIKIQNGSVVIEASSTAELSEILLLTQSYDFFTRQKGWTKAQLDEHIDTPPKAALQNVSAILNGYATGVYSDSVTCVLSWLEKKIQNG